MIIVIYKLFRYFLPALRIASPAVKDNDGFFAFHKDILPKLSIFSEALILLDPVNLERRTRLELVTFSLEGRHSTAELPPHLRDPNPILSMYYNIKYRYVTRKRKKRHTFWNKK